ncbi:glutathione S-transferase N-terminal domain-containing protein [Paraliomyxa miuraensis]|uniref:glutathione S-transferase N-terminal domain-containing protein n=1 Tax=Paraliomyxa miuraensis TaxID=376150 RepID=UPI00224EA5C4|nr:glutathione S-transferase N-terminal domain-containing protein [Paraliomyxa miuraensis]MCX4246928.1 glutathione S-transferase N-terminal domain-containing protein [Paraliomyxa miuraensis]
MPLPRPVDVTSSWTASVLRLGLGLTASHAGPRPERPIEIYEFEACPFCRKVREALTMLDLRATIYPCPKGGPTYRPQVTAKGRTQFPYMVDPNTGEEMFESADIIEYLYRHYGNRSAPWWLRSDVSVPLGSVASVVRGVRGMRYRPARAPEQPLLLYSFEASPFCRIVREALCELELPYQLVNVGKGSQERRAFRERSGRMMVPWLSDPNTGREMFESADIVRYLDQTYGDGTPKGPPA